MSEFNIDPNFSVFRLVERKKELTQQISCRKTMSVVSSVIEQTTHIEDIPNVIFAGFQYLSKFRPQLAIYRQMAQSAKHIYVFGVPDDQFEPIDRITFVPIEPDFQLTKEWFVLSHGEEFSTALATEELSQFTDPDAERRFNGVWLIDDSLITIMYDWLHRTVGERVELEAPTLVHSQRHKTILVNLQQRLDNALQHINDQAARQELDVFMHETVEPVVV